MDTFKYVLLLFSFGAIAGASGGLVISYTLIKAINKFEKKYEKMLLDED